MEQRQARLYPASGVWGQGQGQGREAAVRAHRALRALRGHITPAVAMGDDVQAERRLVGVAASPAS
ncbi:hypothetical protein [Brevundimonas sp.]|uniref:hypothetical protein n=1 Tax=Brevundimonas sp. TaxID=1871086 RepID=UPI00289B0F1A|nr:hypothetical protein [Brevundimonas sp.]